MTGDHNFKEEVIFKGTAILLTIIIAALCPALLVLVSAGVALIWLWFYFFSED